MIKHVAGLNQKRAAKIRRFKRENPVNDVSKGQIDGNYLPVNYWQISRSVVITKEQ